MLKQSNAGYGWVSRGERNLGKPFRAEHLLVQQSKATRRMKKLAYRLSKNLRRLENLARRQRQRKENFDIRQQVRTLKAAKRIPHARIRVTNDLGWLYLPQVIFQSRNAAGIVTRTDLGSQYTVQRGIWKSISDYKPIARLEPPRNSTTIKSTRRNAFNCNVSAIPKEYYYQTAYIPSSPWAIAGLSGLISSLDTTAAVGFDVNEANKALLKCYAEINEATIQINEYIFEWKQLIRLLRDPLRTLLRHGRTIERWTRRDAWIYIPNRTYRRCGKGLVVSKPPTGGMLMSMRTRRTMDCSEAPNKLLSAAANRWLQYRYGIMPLTLDITTAISWYQGNLERPWKNSKSARHHMSRTKQFVDYSSPTQAFNRLFKVSKKSGEHYSAKVWYNIKHEPPLSYKLGVHPDQWLQALWNALPYSFVADWVVNLDDWLTASRTLPWIEYGPNVVTHKLYEKIEARCVQMVYTAAPSTPVVLKGEPLAVQVKEVMRREIDMPRVTGPVLSDRWQTVKNALTGLALIYQPFISKRR